MSEERKRESREVWTKRVERWQDSDLTAKEFAAEVGVNPRTLTWWRCELRRSAKERDGMRPRAKAAPKTSQRSAARSVRRAAAPPAVPQTVASVVAVASSESDRLEVVFGSGLTLRIPQQFDAKAVGQLVAVLREAS